MKPSPFLFSSLLFLFTACNDPKPATENKVPSTDSLVQETGDEDGPPFDKECLCDFHEFGAYKISNSDYNIYKRGKGWNPELYACSWTWGEDVNNIIPEDTNITVMKIHLLDLEHFDLPTNGTEYGHDSIKKYVIAVYTRISGPEQGRSGCVFDPYKTGRYPKPPQWVEE